MKTEVVNVSPKTAVEWLKKNNRNRPINQNLVLKLMAFIQNDQWKLTHQGIAISQTGVLLDGQHRLVAISKGTKSVPMMVVKGLPDDIMTVIDVGKKRNESDAFKLLEVSNYNFVTGALNNFEGLDEGRKSVGPDSGISRGLNIKSIDEKYQFYLDHQSVIDSAVALGQKCYSAIRLYSPSTIAGVTAYLIIRKKNSFASVSEFWLQVCNISNNQQSPATKRLHNTLLKYITGSEKIKPVYKLAITIKAWNLYKSGGDVKLLKYQDGEQMPEFT